MVSADRRVRAAGPLGRCSPRTTRSADLVLTDFLGAASWLLYRDDRPPEPLGKTLARTLDDVLTFRLDSGATKGRRVQTVNEGDPHLVVVGAGRNVVGPAVQGPYDTSDPAWIAFVCASLADVRVDTPSGPVVPWRPASVFIADPPVIEGRPPVFGDGGFRLAAQDWHRIRLLVVGREDRPFWRAQVRTDGRPADPWRLVRGQGSGHYFVRAYDGEDQLQSSFDFQYVAGLREVDVEACPLVPTPGASTDAEAYPACAVSFVAEGCRFTPLASEGGALASQVTSTAGNRTRVTVAVPLAERSIHWAVTARDARVVRAQTPVRRLRWALEDGPDSGVRPASETRWTACVATVDGAQLAATSTVTLVVDVPPALTWTDPQLVAEGTGRAEFFPLRRIESGRWAVRLRALESLGRRALRGEPQIALALRLAGPQGVHRVPVARVVFAYRCKFCPFADVSADQVHRHAAREHAHALLSEASWEEYVRRHPQLPHAVYRCNACGEVVRADLPGQNPTSVMSDHQTRRCPARPAKSLTVLKNPSDILAAIQARVTRVLRCKLCGQSMEAIPTRDIAAKAHLQTHPVTDLVTVATGWRNPAQADPT